MIYPIDLNIFNYTYENLKDWFNRMIKFCNDTCDYNTILIDLYTQLDLHNNNLQSHIKSISFLKRQKREVAIIVSTIVITALQTALAITGIYVVNEIGKTETFKRIEEVNNSTIVLSHIISNQTNLIDLRFVKLKQKINETDYLWS